MKFTLSEFFEQVRHFRGLMGEKDFWSKSDEARGEVLNGLTFVYSNTETGNLNEEKLLMSTFKATLDEYSRRESMVISSQLQTA